MLLLLRKIRQKLMQKNKFTTYLLYAIGEIVLVVIGILIAVSLNNWNQTRKERQQEKFILSQLKKEIAANAKYIAVDIQNNTRSLNSAIAMVKVLQDKQLEQQPALVDSLMAGIYAISGFDPITGFINDVINTGKLEIITDDSIRSQLANWEYVFLDYKDDYNIRNSLLFRELVPYVQKHYPLVNLLPSYNDYVRSGDYSQLRPSELKPNYSELYGLEFEGVLANHIINQEYLIDDAKIYQKYLEELLAQIEEAD